jgi:hypothetical protein
MEARGHMVVARGKSNSEQNGVDFDAESSDEEGDENDFEMKIRRRVKDFEERRELEKKAEEYLQSRVDDGVEETEEDKRMRVRKELEKV